ncbi:MAG: hypothetical protein LPK45_08275, partial [Bacteroidota bacterium]|nr:hypothetical protein [Bacteroidota bacterium]MDX5431064.1 hypothetical protein [Bacteroidota bacterium]MDX5469818.1 hypothetical protein [Bacteroidota bacterium]
IRNEISIPPNIPLSTPFNIPTVPTTYNTEETYEQNNTRTNLVKKITLEYIKLVIKEPAGQDFSFLNDLELSLAKDGLPDKLVAWKYNIENSVGQELTLETTSDALDAYLKNGDVKLKVKVTTDKLTTSEVVINSDIRVRVTADVFK